MPEPDSIPHPTLRWQGDADGFLTMIDQTLLPEQLTEIDCRDIETVHEAIRMLRVRGAPAIGVAAAYGVVIGLQTVPKSAGTEVLCTRVSEVCDFLATSRPTAVNLFWALDRMRNKAKSMSALTPDRFAAELLQEAERIDQEDKQMCRAIGENGRTLLKSGWGVLTHCNAGGLATAGDGTALSVFFAAVRSGLELHVFADETRPLLQGARLTSWELQQRSIPVTVICDGMAAQVMKEGRIQAVVTGADRIAANGDAANKIGTYGVAVLAKHHGIPFYVAAPSSTFDLSLEDGSRIPIEQRSPTEISHGFGRRTVPEGVDVYNPAFDVTPASLIDALITERGIIRNPTTKSVKEHLEPS